MGCGGPAIRLRYHLSSSLAVGSHWAYACCLCGAGGHRRLRAGRCCRDRAGPGDPAGGGWVRVGPGPFYVVGLIGADRSPGQRVAVWLLACGTTFHGGCVPRGRHGVSARLHRLAGAASCGIAGNLSNVAGIGLIGLFPTGKPQRPRRALGTWRHGGTGGAAAAAVGDFSPRPPADLFGYAGQPAIVSPLFLLGAHPVDGPPSGCIRRSPSGRSSA